MLKRFSLSAAVALCSLTFVLAPARSAHAATQTVTAQATDVPWILAWVDSASGSAPDKNVAQSFHDQYLNTTWTIDGKTITITSSAGKALAVASFLATQDGTQFFLHARSGSSTIDGQINRGIPQSDGSMDMSQGYADLYLVVPSKDGKSWASVHFQPTLTFGGGGATPTTGGLGGF